MQPEPKKHVSHTIAWSLIALFAGSLAFGIWMYSNQIDTIYAGSVSVSVTHKKTAATKPTTATTGTTITDATADWKTYTNSTYGFQLTFTDAWKGYTVKEEKSTDNLSVGKISFYMTTTDQSWIDQLKTNQVKPFVITVCTPEQWAQVQADNVPQPTYITKNNQYAFVYSTWQDAPADLVAKKLDIENVIPTFKFTN